MPQYAYRAIQRNGRQVRGSMAAANEMDLYKRLSVIGLELLDYGDPSQRREIRLFPRGIKPRDLIQLCLHLDALLGAGVPLLDSLEDLRDSAEGSLRDLLTEIHRDVSEGASLSEAMEKRPRHFGPVMVAMVAAGEETGDLAGTFAMLAEHLKWVDDIKRSTRRAVRYPSIIAVVLFCVMIFMMSWVVPRIAEFLLSADLELPWVTRSLLATSDFFQRFWYLVIAVPVAGLVAARMLYLNSEGFAWAVDYYTLRLPWLGKVMRKLSLARFAHMFAILFQTGIPLLDCLDTSKRLVGNRALADALEAMKAQVQAGTALSEAMAGTGEFPSLVTRMVRVGEGSGNLAKTLTDVSEFYNRDVRDSVADLITLLEPGLILLMGLLMLWIALGTFLPVYGNIANLSGGG
jgi:type IV pilus assembly protein PilC